MIAPHAGYVYSGRVAAAAFATLRDRAASITRVVLLRRVWGGTETLIVISSDLSHYHSYETARRLDLATATAIEHGNWASLGPDQAFGYLAVTGLLIETERRGLKARRLELCNSGDTVGSRDQVVGYGAWLFGQTAS
ncbi:MAG: AmmeMemoRadiSam system protein B [Xanthobacteraceae bacterium]